MGATGKFDILPRSKHIQTKEIMWHLISFDGVTHSSTFWASYKNRKIRFHIVEFYT